MIEKIEERINLDTLLEAAILFIAAYFAIKLFDPLLTIVLVFAAAVILYVGIRNRDLLLAKLKELKGDAQDLI